MSCAKVVLKYTQKSVPGSRQFVKSTCEYVVRLLVHAFAKKIKKHPQSLQLISSVKCVKIPFVQSTFYSEVKYFLRTT